jgi:hypothetical protein
MPPTMSIPTHFAFFRLDLDLSSTNFEYYDLTVATATIRAGQVVRAQVNVANVGSRAAVETVQLYTRDLVACPVRPVKELRDFRRVALSRARVGAGRDRGA